MTEYFHTSTEFYSSTSSQWDQFLQGHLLCHIYASSVPVIMETFQLTGCYATGYIALDIK